MKKDHPIITLLGSNSGNNVGDAAILASILDVLSKEIPQAEFLVPTTKPSFIRSNYSNKYNVRPVNIMPWTLSVRFLGVPTFLSLLRSDVALICDGIIFGKKLLNPLFNFLIVLVFLVPWAKFVGCKLVCYSCGIGPFPSRLSKNLARYLMNNCDLIMLRERDSEQLAREIGVTKDIHITGDAAFLNVVSSEERAIEILKEEGINENRHIIGVNITAYFDTWIYDQDRIVGKGDFLRNLAEGLTKAVSELDEDIQLLLFSTHPMDLPILSELASLLNCRVLDSRKYLSHDIQSIMKRCELFIGMRFHSLVLASAVYTPIVALVYAPKVRGYMRFLECEDLALDLSKLEKENFKNTVINTWRNRTVVKSKQNPIVEKLKSEALKAARQVFSYIR